MILFYVRMVRWESLVISRDGSLLVHYYCYNSRSRPVFMLTFQKLVNWVGSLIGIAVIMDHVTAKSEKKSTEARVLNCQKDFKRVA